MTVNSESYDFGAHYNGLYAYIKYITFFLFTCSSVVSSNSITQPAFHTQDMTVSKNILHADFSSSFQYAYIPKNVEAYWWM
jgi:hypothetical protein